MRCVAIAERRRADAGMWNVATPSAVSRDRGVVRESVGVAACVPTPCGAVVRDAEADDVVDGRREGRPSPVASAAGGGHGRTRCRCTGVR